MTTNEKLKSLMGTRKLSRQAIADATRSTIHAVDGWLRETDSPSYRVMPIGKLELLTMKLKEAQS
jgi:hypothetical protein